MIIPNTPAADALAAWLDDFDSRERARIEALLARGRLVRGRCVSRGADGGGAESVDVADVGRLDTPLDRAAAGRPGVDKLLDTFEERLHVTHRQPGFGPIVVRDGKIASVGARTRSITKLDAA